MLPLIIVVLKTCREWTCEEAAHGRECVNSLAVEAAWLCCEMRRPSSAKHMQVQILVPTFSPVVTLSS